MSDVKSAVTSGLRYRAGSCTSYSNCSRTVSNVTMPPVPGGFVITATPSSSTSAIGNAMRSGSGFSHHAPE